MDEARVIERDARNTTATILASPPLSLNAREGGRGIDRSDFGLQSIVGRQGARHRIARNYHKRELRFIKRARFNCIHGYPVHCKTGPSDDEERNRGGKRKHVHNITIGNARYSAAGNCSIDETAGRYPGCLARIARCGRALRDGFFPRNNFSL